MVFLQHMTRIEVIKKAHYRHHKSLPTDLPWVISVYIIFLQEPCLRCTAHHSSTVHNDISTGENQLPVVRDCSFNKFAATLNISGRLDLYHSKNLP